jgi:uncharacterized protein YjiS (DUF1127 family)
MIMSTISSIPVGGQTGAAAGPLHGIGVALRGLWFAYLERRLHRQAAAQLHAMGDRELKDIGLNRSEIESALRGHDPLAPHFVRGRYY